MTADLFLAFALGWAACAALMAAAEWISDNLDRRREQAIRELSEEAERVIRHGDQHPWVER